MNSILDVHAPLKKVNKYKLKFKTNPGLPLLYQFLLKKFVTAKDSQVKERYHKEYKDSRNMLCTILKESKTNNHSPSLKKFVTAKDSQVKERYHKECKDSRNMLCTILKESKTNNHSPSMEPTLSR